jgi:hypothetical protein
MFADGQFLGSYVLDNPGSYFVGTIATLTAFGVAQESWLVDLACERGRRRIPYQGEP